jgi:hypothetical protein
MRFPGVEYFGDDGQRDPRLLCDPRRSALRVPFVAINGSAEGDRIDRERGSEVASERAILLYNPCGGSSIRDIRDIRDKAI